MDYRELAEELRQAFTPFAFLCECKGADADCQRVMDSEPEQIRYYFLERITRYIENKG